MNAHITENIPYSTRPILSVLGYVPKTDEDLERLVADALAAETRGNDGDKDLDLPAFQVDRTTGNVLLYRYSAWAEENYQEERQSWYDDDPLGDLHYQQWDTRSYTTVQSGGVTLSYLVKKGH